MSKNGLNGADVVNGLSPNDQGRPLLTSSRENFYSLYDKNSFETTRLFLKLFKKMCSLGIVVHRFFGKSLALVVTVHFEVLCWMQ